MGRGRCQDKTDCGSTVMTEWGYGTSDIIARELHEPIHISPRIIVYGPFRNAFEKRQAELAAVKAQVKS